MLVDSNRDTAPLSGKVRKQRTMEHRYEGGEWSWLLVIGRLQSLYTIYPFIRRVVK